MILNLVFASDGRYYLHSDTYVSGTTILPLLGATPRDSFGRTLDEPTMDDGCANQGDL